MSDMNERSYMEIVHTLAALKDTTRHCYTPGGRRESVAEHTYRICAMAFFLQEEFKDIDVNKVIKMCIIHDFGEIFTGDIASFNKTDADEEREEQLLSNWVKSLPGGFPEMMGNMYEEMKALKTPEAKLYKALDSLEAVISHNESDIDTWEELEYELNQVYGNDKVAFSDFLIKVRALAKAETLEKINAKEK